MGNRLIVIRLKNKRSKWSRSDRNGHVQLETGDAMLYVCIDGNKRTLSTYQLINPSTGSKADSAWIVYRWCIDAVWIVYQNSSRKQISSFDPKQPESWRPAAKVETRL
jgi:hypothetical protein